MILQSLETLYHRLATDPDYGVSESGYAPMKVGFIITLFPDGRFQISKAPRGLEISCPTMGRSINTCPLFLADKSDYVLGFNIDSAAKSDGRKKLKERHEAFKQLHRNIQKRCSHPMLQRVLVFLEAWDPKGAAAHAALSDLGKASGANFVFQVGEAATTYIHDVPELKAAWQDYLANPPTKNETGETSADTTAAQGEGEPADEDQGEGQSTPTGVCLLTGASNQALALTHPKIKGVYGAQTSGALLVSFNQDAFTSYGKKQSLNAPVSKAAADRYTTALNVLLSKKHPEHRVLIGGDTVVFWTEQRSAMEEVIKGMAEPPTDKSKETQAQKQSIIEKVNLFYEAVRNGQEPLQALRDKGSERFCILSLAAPAKARLSVRYFTKGSVADLSDNLAQHLRDIGIDRQFLPGHPKRKPDPLYPDLRLILRQTAREYSEIPPLLGAALLRAVLDKTVPYPDALAQSVLRRCSVEHNVNYPKAAILKGWLIRSHLNNSPLLTMSLDTTRKDPAYLYGRMFAVMEQTQAIALGNINASIADRFYSSASSTPGVVFPRLESMFRDHLKKANARYPGMATTRLNLMSEINDKLTDPQNTLNLQERALFAIGYYHQRQALMPKSKNNPTTPTTQSTPAA